ncbi:MAG TPA: hypothetical protein VIF09_26575 [Polyangiaceae bacterium]|jgi:hypothetical protein
MPWPPHVLGLAGFAAATGLALLIAFHPTSRAEAATSKSPPPAATVKGPVWEPTVVNAPGLPVQCADGAWTRTAVRGGCAKHGGAVYY